MSNNPPDLGDLPRCAHCRRPQDDPRLSMNRTGEVCRRVWPGDPEDVSECERVSVLFAPRVVGEVAGMKLVADPTMPRDRIELRSGDARAVLRIGENEYPIAGLDGDGDEDDCADGPLPGETVEYPPPSDAEREAFNQWVYEARGTMVAGEGPLYASIVISVRPESRERIHAALCERFAGRTIDDATRSAIVEYVNSDEVRAMVEYDIQIALGTPTGRREEG